MCELRGGWNTRLQCTVIGRWLEMNHTFHLLIRLTDYKYTAISSTNNSALSRSWSTDLKEHSLVTINYDINCLAVAVTWWLQSGPSHFLLIRIVNISYCTLGLLQLNRFWWTDMTVLKSWSHDWPYTASWNCQCTTCWHSQSLRAEWQGA